jgi:hypothetical protein
VKSESYGPAQPEHPLQLKPFMVTLFSVAAESNRFPAQRIDCSCGDPCPLLSASAKATADPPKALDIMTEGEDGSPSLSPDIFYGEPLQTECFIVLPGSGKGRGSE